MIQPERRTRACSTIHGSPDTAEPGIRPRAIRRSASSRDQTGRGRRLLHQAAREHQTDDDSRTARGSRM